MTFEELIQKCLLFSQSVSIACSCIKAVYYKVLQADVIK